MDSNEKYLSGVAVRKRYGVSRMSIDRWLHDEALAFPRPLVIRRKLYFKESDLIAWEDNQRFRGTDLQR